MSAVIAVFKREFKSYFGTPLAYVFLAIFLMASSLWMFMGDFFLRGEASMTPFFANIPALFAVFAPLIAMRMWSEERRTGTIEMLLSLPITTGQAVLGKFLAAWVFLFISLLMTLPIYFTLLVLGRPEFGPVFTGYFGAFLLGGAYLAISGFFSVITKSQVISFVLGLIACVAFLLLGQPFILGFLDANFPTFVSEMFESLSASTQFDKMQRGMIEMQSLLFMLVLIVGFLFASSVMLDERKAA